MATLVRLVLSGLALVACTRAAPASRFPTAEDAIARMRATYACSRGVQGESKVDYFGEQGRVRGSALFVTSRPEQLRIDVFSPFGVTLSTLTSDGRDFALLDVGAKQFFFGPASECNVARFLRVPVPPAALVAMLAGEAPVLVHGPRDASIAWESGAYVVSVRSRHGATEQIRLEPTSDDWARPWSEQRVRVREVRVVQQGIELYRAELDGFAVARTAARRVDPDGIEPDVPPSGPACDAEVPRRIHIVSEASAQDVLLTHEEVSHNPPLQPGTFVQTPPGGVKLHASMCGL
jgi:outer membrane lipoprotein-sorting protein